MRLLKEVGAIGNPDPTYEISVINPVDLINDDVALCERYGLKLDEGQKTLPIMHGLQRCIHPFASPFHCFVS